MEVRGMGVGVGGHDWLKVTQQVGSRVRAGIPSSNSRLSALPTLVQFHPEARPPYCRPLRSWLPLLRSWEGRSRRPEQEAPLALPPTAPSTLRPLLLAILLHGGPHTAKAAQPSCQAAAPVLSQTGKGQRRRFHGNSRGPRCQPNPQNPGPK